MDEVNIPDLMKQLTTSISTKQPPWYVGDPAQDSLSDDESHAAASTVSVRQVEQQEAMGWVGGGEAGTMFCQLYCA